MKIKPTDKEILEIRNQIFVEDGIINLESNGYVKTPFSTGWYGRNNLNDYSYELCRLNKKNDLEILNVEISRGDNWIKIYLNIFKPTPELHEISQIKGYDGLKYQLPPNSIKRFRLRVDGNKGVPLLRDIFIPNHKLGKFITRKGFKKKINKLKNLITEDFKNIDSFVELWYKNYKPNLVDWNGSIVANK